MHLWHLPYSPLGLYAAAGDTSTVVIRVSVPKQGQYYSFCFCTLEPSSFFPLIQYKRSDFSHKQPKSGKQLHSMRNLRLTLCPHVPYTSSKCVLLEKRVALVSLIKQRNALTTYTTIGSSITRKFFGSTVTSSWMEWWMTMLLIWCVVDRSS